MALILKTNQYFTLAFLMLPKGDKFTWHDHPDMNAICKYAFGSFDVKALDQTKMIPKGERIFYEKKYERI